MSAEGAFGSGTRAVSPMSSTETIVKRTVAKIEARSKVQEAGIRSRPNHNSSLPETRGGVRTRAQV